MSLTEKIQSGSQKKILALDGGGIRGILSVEILAKIEEMLRQKTGGDKEFVLADYFDFFAGTSTGAIIAACLSWGMTVDRIRNFYLQNGKEMFDKASLLDRYYRHKFQERKVICPAAGGIWRGNNSGKRETENVADDGVAQCIHGFSLAGLEQPRRKIQ